MRRQIGSAWVSMLCLLGLFSCKTTCYSTDVTFLQSAINLNPNYLTPSTTDVSDVTTEGLSRSVTSDTIVQMSPTRALINGFIYDLSGLKRLTFEENGWLYALRLDRTSRWSGPSWWSCHHNSTVYKIALNSPANDDGPPSCTTYGLDESATFLLINAPKERELARESYGVGSKYGEEVNEQMMKLLTAASSSSSSLLSPLSWATESPSTNNKDDHPAKLIAISYRYMNKKKLTSALVFLTCDMFRTRSGDGLLQILWKSEDRSAIHFELRHLCCCPDICTKRSIVGDALEEEDPSISWKKNKTIPIFLKNAESTHRPRGASNNVDTKSYIWIIIIINACIVSGAIFIAAFCCRRAGTGFTNTDGPYNYLSKPWSNHISSHSSRNSIYRCKGSPPMRNDAVDEDYEDGPPPPADLASAASRDYSTSREHQESQLLSLTETAECHVIQGRNLELRQRLGGGVFCDSYMAIWGRRKVVAKRIVVGLHSNNQDFVDLKLKWIMQSVAQLAKLRHRNLVTVLGVCVETKKPHIIQEFVEGACLKTIISNNPDEVFPWKKKLRIGRYVAEAMSYLHSLHPPLIHRDLRCSNIFIDSSSKVKLGDFGLTRIFQSLRSQCEGWRNCFCEKSTSAFPSTIRWTAPEILSNPRTEEAYSYYSHSVSSIALSTHSSYRSLADPSTPATASATSSNVSLQDIITTACDVYSFGMIMWELLSHSDPFFEVADEVKVVELVLGGYRPDINPTPSFVPGYPSPHYRDLVELCWDPKPELRPSFKQILVSFKSMTQISDATRPGTPAASQENATNLYLKSALNIQ